MQEKHVDWLIIGAGPAGLQFGFFCQQHQIDYLILERGNTPGSFFKKFPRHRTLNSTNKVCNVHPDEGVNLRFDGHSLLTEKYTFPFNVYSSQYHPTRASLVRYLKDFANQYHLNIKFKQTVVSVTKTNKFKVTTQHGDVYYCNKLFVATGLAKPFIPDIPGILFARNYSDMPTDPKHYLNKSILILGQGNSAFETANSLLDVASQIHLVSKEAPKFAWETNFNGDLHGHHCAFIEASRYDVQHALLYATVKKIKFRENKFYVDLQIAGAGQLCKTHVYDEVITCTGFKFDSSIFSPECTPMLEQGAVHPKLNAAYESLNIADLFFLGALMQSREYRKYNTGVISGFRYNIAFLFKWLLSKREGVEYPRLIFKDNVKHVVHQIINRVNFSSSLWHQSGLFADIAVYDLQSKQYIYYSSVPLDFVRQGRLCSNQHYFSITLEHGVDEFFCGDAQATNAKFMNKQIHPVIRHYYNTHLLSEYHVQENLGCVWSKAEEIEGVIDYINQETAPIRMEHAVKYNEHSPKAEDQR